IKDSGRQVTFFEALSRNLLRFVDYLPAIYLAGVITMLCTKRHQRLGDLAAGTIVVHERTDEQPLLIGRGSAILPVSEAFDSAPVNVAQGVAALPADAVARLGPDDLLLIETFFARALDLSLSTRMEVATKIANQMAVKMSGDANAVPPPGNPERFLESIAFAMRSTARSRQ
ncbi:MAG: RDD family protein, partial [Acidobacteriaceae bacterium]